ncbi:hypothetical protein H0H92_012110 [Tricholoma furcatifolium]|nr:hypothetical protein H0H92_012110 [Tricholoma furcatifolium]
MEETTLPSGQPIVSREKTAPFLIRTFVKIGNFHRLSLFEDGTLPTTDEQQLFMWKDATLREVLTGLRNTAPHVAEYRHPLARFSFRTVYADSLAKGRFAQKDLGMVYSRDILGEPGALDARAPRFDWEGEGEGGPSKEERTLDELRFVAGDYLLVAVLLPKSVSAPTEVAPKASVANNGWRGGAGAGAGAGAGPGPGAGAVGRGGGHWRGDSSGRGGRGRERRGGGGRRSMSRSRSPPPARKNRY